MTESMTVQSFPLPSSSALPSAPPVVRSQPETSSIIPGMLVICGATASGKSGLGVAIAQKLQDCAWRTYIVSADSRQIYREFSIGTAKASLEDRARVPHFLVDEYDPRETVSVAMFQDQTQQILTRETGLPLLVGGTGLYLRAITHGMRIPRVAQHRELRDQLERLGQTVCHQILAQVDPIAAQKIHPNDRIRTVRALEVFYVTGQAMTAQQGEQPPGYPILQIGLRSQRLNDRIRLRTHQMFEAGFVDEVKILVAQYGDELPLLETLGYQEVRQYLRGEISQSEAIELTILHTQQFAKRQRTWFNGIQEIEWYDADENDLVDQVWQRVQQFLISVN